METDFIPKVLFTKYCNIVVLQPSKTVLPGSAKMAGIVRTLVWVVMSAHAQYELLAGIAK